MEPPVDLTVPEPGSSTARRILGAYLKRTLADFLRLPAARFDTQVADDFGTLRAHIERLSRSGDAGLAFSVLRRATVSTLLRCIDAELWARGDVTKLDGWLAQLNGLLAFELAHAGALPEAGLRLRKRTSPLVSLASGIALTVSPEHAVEFGCRCVTVQHGSSRKRLALDGTTPLGDLPGATLSHPYTAIVDGLSLATLDVNPLSAMEAHPDKQGNAIDLGERSPAEWTTALRDAYQLIATYLPDLAAEIRLVMQLIVPVGYDAERHLSASYAEAIGIAYLSLHPDGMTMAEALIHEFSHNKLNALFRLDPVLENAHSPLFSSPVRPDPRPLSGVLLAVHAFTPVARLYEKMLEADDARSRDPSFMRRYRQVAEGNHEAVATLTEHARPTHVGRGVLEELGRWDAHFAGARTAPPGS